MNFRYAGLVALGVGTLVPIALVARAEIYLTSEQAAHLIFPGISFAQKQLTLSGEQATTIKKTAGEAVRNKTLTAFVGPNKETVFIDQVVGKHEFITIAVGIKPDNSVAGVEILEYKETYGYQVRNPEWRNQFIGKDTHASLRVGTDIQNISGATLSSVHVTNGVRRLVETYAVLAPSL